MTTQTNDVVSHRIGADGLVAIRAHDGHITLHGVAGDDATIRAADGASLDTLEIERGERSLAVRPRGGIDFLGPDFLIFGRRAKDLHLEIPAGATVIVEGASADIDVRGLHGDQRYRSASGDLVLHDVRGSMTIEAVSGDVELAADGPATIAARTVSGDLDLRAGSVGALRATTTSGDLRLSARFDGAGPYAIETVSGDATLAPGDDVRIEAKTITGDIDSDLPSRRDDGDGRRALVIGVGGPTISFRSASGDLRVVATTPPAPRPETSPTLPTPPAPPDPVAPPPVSVADHDDARLGILRDLERGDIDVHEAGRRLEELDIEASAADDDGEGHDHA